jgi:hypothetical protein
MKSQRTTVVDVMARPFAKWRLCSGCADLLDYQRHGVGIAGCAFVYCSHKGMHAAWVSASLQLQLCASLEEARRIEAGFDAFFALVRTKTTPTPTGGTKPN